MFLFLQEGYRRSFMLTAYVFSLPDRRLHEGALMQTKSAEDIFTAGVIVAADVRME